MKLTQSTEWLFFHLWKKQADGSCCPGVLILDTVIFRWAKPHFWYFMNEVGQIIRKTKENITMEQIVDQFSCEAKESDVVALYLST